VRFADPEQLDENFKKTFQPEEKKDKKKPQEETPPQPEEPPQVAADRRRQAEEQQKKKAQRRKRAWILFAALMALLVAAIGLYEFTDLGQGLWHYFVTVEKLEVSEITADSMKLTLTTNTDLKWIDGFLKQFGADNAVLTESIAAGTNAYEGILQVILALPEEAVERGAVVFVAPAIYRKFVAGLVATNLYHYAGPADTAPEEFIFPGTDVRVVKTPGLAGSLKIVGTFADNLVYGTDGENDSEDVDLWWSQDDRVFKYQVKWNSGVAYRYSDQIVVGTFAAAPSALGICPCNAAPSDGE
jgi:hypothetical protein